MNWNNKIALVTGASSGIGWVTAEYLAARGLRVALTARRADRLAELAECITAAGGTALALPADLRDATAREGVLAAIREQWGPVEVLINNAGLGWGGDFAAMPWETAETLLDVNIAALTHLTRLVLPDMLARREGWIVNIGSIAGDTPTSDLALYCATKSFVHAFTEGLYRNLRGTGVCMAMVNPGPVVSEFGAVAYNWSEEKSKQHGTPTVAVARAVWRALDKRRKRLYVPGYLGVGRWLNLLLEWPMDRGLYNTLRKVMEFLAR